MPTYERRFFLSRFTKDIAHRNEEYETSQENIQQASGSNGNRTKKVSGEALKAQIKSGNLPLQ